MPIETPHQTIPDLQELKERYKQKLDAILYKELSPDNIDTFADNALDDLVVLTGDILEQYRTNPSFEPAAPDPLYFDQDQENDAYKKLQLPDIQEILVRVDEVRGRIEDLKGFINDCKIETEKVITPPQPDHQEIASGSGQGIEDKKLVPRLLTLLYLLETDLEVAKDAVRITEGIVTPEMMRKAPYVRVEIPDLKRAVYLCDEEGNASYVFDTEKLDQAGLTLEEIDHDGKGDKNSLIAMRPGIGARIIYTKYWRSNMADVLSEQIPEKATTSPGTLEGYENEPRSEFEKRDFLPLEKLKEEVRAVHSGEGDVKEWYHRERKHREGWPSHPAQLYKGSWKGWPDLAGKEEKEFLNFRSFEEEAKKLYPGMGDVAEWYDHEKEKHKNWPAAPNMFFKRKGWVGWPELVGKENMLKKTFLSYADFKKEALALYTGGDVQEWFHAERKNHPLWPSSPHGFYKKDWQGWSALVGVQSHLEKEFLPFGDFVAEVRLKYPGSGDVQRWYRKERSQHSNWPSLPPSTYKTEWQGWPKLVGRESHLEKEFLSLDDFVAEVRTLYPGSGDVQDWYKAEKKKHPNWPAAPYRYYKNDWRGWPALVRDKK